MLTPAAAWISIGSDTQFMQQLVSFVRGHLLQAVLIIPGSVVITLIHESVHALMVVSQGGSVSEFQWLPSSEGWGHIRFTFPKATTYSSAVISLAPHILSVLLVLGTVLLAWRRPSLKDRAAAFIYFWLFFVPLADVGFALLVWTLGGDNDVARAFGPSSAWSVVSVVAYGLAAYLLGYVVQARLYDRLKLGWLPYSVLVMTALVLMGGFLAVLSGFSPKGTARWGMDAPPRSAMRHAPHAPWSQRLGKPLSILQLRCA